MSTQHNGRERPEPAIGGGRWPLRREDAVGATPHDDEFWPWWRKVRHEIESRGITVAELARRSGIARRSIHRWLYEVDDAVMGERGPRSEIAICIRLAGALDWSIWYTMFPTMDWPPVEGCNRWGKALKTYTQAVSKAPPDRRRQLLQITMNSMADVVELITETVCVAEKNRNRARAEAREVLGEEGGMR